MTIAIQILQIIFYSVATLFMITFMFIGIWSFIIFLKLYKTKKLQNDILSKINDNISQALDSKVDLSTETESLSVEYVDKNSCE